MAQNASNVSSNLIEKLRTLDDLPHFPDALMKLEQLLLTGDVHLEDISEVVALDPRLTAGLISVVNSARFSPGYEIGDINDAVNRLGVSDVRSMAHAINYKAAIKTKPPFSERDFMHHSMLAAFIAQKLASQVHVNQAEAFLCGLMHDIGIYLLAVEDREKYKQVIEKAHGDVDQLIRAESEIFMTAHPIMGARLLRQWKFPPSIIMGVAGHHAPHKTKPEFQSYAYLTFLAEEAVYTTGATNGVVGLLGDDLPEDILTALDYFGLSHQQFNEIVQDALDDASNSGLM